MQNNLKIESLELSVSNIDGSIDIQILDGKLYISIPKSLECVIEHRNAGLPGICGPNITHDIQNLSHYVCEEQKELAKKGWCNV